MSTIDKSPTLTEVLKDCPRNWGRWGVDDEVGALNFLTAGSVLEAIKTVRSGKVFTLQMTMCDPMGDLVAAERQPAQRFMVMDRSDYAVGKAEPYPGGFEYADDYLITFLQGTTHYDALGHVWTDGHIWNGFSAETTIGGLERASVLPIASRGIVGRGVLLDMAKACGKDVLAPGESFGLADLQLCAESQTVELQPHDVLVIRTGWLDWLRRQEPAARRGLREPGLRYSLELVSWFHEMGFPNLVTDTIANELSADDDSGVSTPLHIALMSYQGVTFTEMAWLEELAADCATDGQYEFLFVAAPLKVVGATGSPVNPVVIK